MPEFSPAQLRRLLHPPALSLPKQPLRPRTRRSAGKAAGSSATEAYPLGTLQGDGRLRTTLGGIFSILPGRTGIDRP